MTEAILLVLVVITFILSCKVEKLRKTFLGMKYEVNATFQNAMEKMKQEVKPVEEVKIIKKRIRKPPAPKAPSRSSPAIEMASLNRSQAMKKKWAERKAREFDEKFESLAVKVKPPFSREISEN